MPTEHGKRYAQVISENPGRTYAERKRRSDAHSDFKVAEQKRKDKAKEGKEG